MRLLRDRYAPLLSLDAAWGRCLDRIEATFLGVRPAGGGGLGGLLGSLMQGMGGMEGAGGIGGAGEEEEEEDDDVFVITGGPGRVQPGAGKAAGGGGMVDVD